jgi:hypothetical protein
MSTPITNINIYPAGRIHELLATATAGILLHAEGHNRQVIIQEKEMQGGDRLEAGKSYVVTADKIPMIKHAVLDILGRPVFEDGTLWLFTETGKTKID